MWTVEITLLFLFFLFFSISFVYELLYFSEVVETEEWLGIKLPRFMRSFLQIKPIVSIFLGLFMVLYLILMASVL
ncbi:hypothetical protein A3H85_02570 [Candidatus Daviesbacteria bacterium RIFCSPLOWO2_02_FULL_40_8]|uniref:Uncharacterized protein n=1 Tax=Candidatus Daviesbacteria bacterium RIFCSPLOWO2_01_FULL_40_24 TaxID=1797787 RepID=A0A1F5MII0_9BACT|nr:MAG: hypothetical protein A2780_03300 [Candidatus Daviesbacteria bacterium RIFCSPHIGHO2_01_FULL_41_45]OGE34174.1 MAG: hypothetical protein A3C32_00385 [Candidatus Daviesbacteria bacterium RIFCSPHIGHO2_02_FULL_41_14]OGE65158.1 MAG: hypothetical protein A3B49_01335 [Candidatus Daviesbacteria bacterium RIFCSPLOWO2_01_FULL_40_24]OGE66861.1 MAG: hypothetical protein A3H85_02570 [Candidatus Daviesbacteria bacterium RIFCSPLOWO2_02_FULL_40_8]